MVEIKWLKKSEWSRFVLTKAHGLCFLVFSPRKEIELFEMDG